MALSVCCFLWIFTSIAIVLWLMLLKFKFSDTFHKYLHTLFYFGKLRNSKVAIQSFQTDVPKRWFLHFYVIGVLCNSTVSLLYICVMLFEREWPEVFKIVFRILNVPNNASQNEKYDGLSILVILLMEEVQVLRRLYECIWVHSFSVNNMSIVHYLMGVMFYSLFGLSVLSEVNLNKLECMAFGKEAIIVAIPAVCLFIWACVQQHHTFLILAQLRVENKDSKRSSSGHFLPIGGLFQYISCPHYLAEILIYFSMNLIVLFQHRTLLCCFIFVCVNQTTVALITHLWYKNTFSSYPKHRKAIIPYIL